MKIEIDLELLLEARDGLKAYGKTATENTVKKIHDTILEQLGPSFGVGDNVNVRRMEGDLFNHDFTGHVKIVDEKSGMIVVEDQAGDCWSCEPRQLSFSSDDIMHV